MWSAVLQIATNRILERDWCWWRWSLTRAAPPHAPSLHARTGASADQSLGAPRCCTACITSTNAVPEPDRGSAVPQPFYHVPFGVDPFRELNKPGLNLSAEQAAP